MSPDKKITLALTIVDSTTNHLFSYPIRSKRPPLQLIKTFIQLSHHHEYKSYILWFDEDGEHSISSDSMQLFIDHEVIVETTGGYAFSINGKVECPHQTINNTFHIQLLSRVHIYELWCLCYK